MQSIKRQMSRRKPAEDATGRTGTGTATPPPASPGIDPNEPAGSPGRRKSRLKSKTGSKTGSMLRLPAIKKASASPPTSPQLSDGSPQLGAVSPKEQIQQQPQQTQQPARQRTEDDVRKKLAGLFFWDKKNRGNSNPIPDPGDDKSASSASKRGSTPSLSSHHSRTKSDSASLLSHNAKSRLKVPERPSDRRSSESAESGRMFHGSGAYLGSGSGANSGATSGANSGTNLGLGPRQSRSRSGSGGAAVSLGLGSNSGRSKPRFKNKAGSVGRSSRDSIGSSSSQGSGGYANFPAVPSAGIPFPTIRSQSSFTDASKRETEQRPRRKTDGDVSFDMSGSDRVGGSPFLDNRAGTPGWHLNSPIMDEPLPVRPKDMSSEEYAQLLQDHAPPGTPRWRRICVQLAQDAGEDPVRTMVAYLQSHFSFSGEPVDMSLRKFLLYITLPGETQQIERVLQAFSELYNTHNPEAFTDAEQVLFIVFSLVILHTDTFNRNIRHKMGKRDYVQSTYSEGVPIEILEYLYDNITCLKFQKDETVPAVAAPPGYYLGTSVISSLEISRERSNGDGLGEDSPSEGTTSRRSTISMSMPWNSSNGNSSSGSYDVYSLLLNNRLDVLRPNIGGEDLDNDGDLYTDTCPELDVSATKIRTTQELESVLSYYFGGHGGLYSLQLMSPRSRPDAYLEKLLKEDGLLAAEELIQKTRPGVVEVRVIKYGLILRPEPKRMLYPAKPGWREWGAILTESQLYLFRSTAWIRTALESKSTTDALRPPAELLASATVLPTVDLAALPMATTSQPTQNQVPNQFMLVSQGSSTPLSVATPYEQEYIDWIRLLNVTATFATFHIPAPCLELDPSQADEQPRPQHVRTSSASALDPPQVNDEIRMSIIVEQIREVDRRLESVQAQINENRRTLKHLKLLAPIQQRTRESVMYSAGLYASKLEACCLSRRKLRCYKHIMELDMELLEKRVVPGSLSPTPEVESAGNS